MKLIDIVSPDELEAELFADGSADNLRKLYSELNDTQSDWQPFNAMLEARTKLGDLHHVNYCAFMTIIGAMTNIIARKKVS